MIYICIILFFAFFLGLLQENLKGSFFAAFSSIVTLVMILIFTIGITKTADWIMYKHLYVNLIDKTDPVFIFLSRQFKSLHYPYIYLFRFHIIVSLAIYYLLISRFTKNILFVIVIYLLLDYVHFINQIRYYLGFPIMLLGFYYFLVPRKYVLSLLLMTIGVLCHSALSPLLLFLPFFHYTSTEKYLKHCLIYSGVAFVIFFAVYLSGIASTLKHFSIYLESKNESSILGGLFNALPYMLVLGYLYLLSAKWLKSNDKRLKDPKFKFLYKITFFGIILLPSAFLIQIIGHRYIMPFGIFWVLYFLFLTRNFSPAKRMREFALFTAVIFVSAFSIYILPDFVLGQNHFAKEIKNSIHSIPYLKNYFR